MKPKGATWKHVIRARFHPGGVNPWHNGEPYTWGNKPTTGYYGIVVATLSCNHTKRFKLSKLPKHKHVICDVCTRDQARAAASASREYTSRPDPDPARPGRPDKDRRARRRRDRARRGRR